MTYADPMHDYTFLEKLLARDPRTQVKFPENPLDQALRDLEELETKYAAAAQRAASPKSEPTEMPALAGSIAAIVTNLWRAKVKMVDGETGEAREETRKIYRHVESALESFTHLGLVITDLVNQPYDAGLPVKVLTFQPTAGLTRDTILEVIRPTVIWRDTIVQMGEIVVGIPLQSTPEPV